MLPEGESQEGVGYDVWEDPWIPTISNFKPKPFNPASQCQINRVSDLICTSPVENLNLMTMKNRKEIEREEESRG